MAEFTATVIIHRPVATVFAFFVRPENWWRQANGEPRTAVTQVPRGPLAVGTRFLDLNGTDDMGPSAASLEVVEYVPPQFLAVSIRGNAGSSTLCRYQFTPVPAGTRVDSYQHWEWPAVSTLHPDFGDAGVTQIAEAFLASALDRSTAHLQTALAAQLVQIKQTLEAADAPTIPDPSADAEGSASDR